MTPKYKRDSLEHQREIRRQQEGIEPTADGYEELISKRYGSRVGKIKREEWEKYLDINKDSDKENNK